MQAGGDLACVLPVAAALVQDEAAICLHRAALQYGAIGIDAGGGRHLELFEYVCQQSNYAPELMVNDALQAVGRSTSWHDDASISQLRSRYQSLCPDSAAIRLHMRRRR